MLTAETDQTLAVLLRSLSRVAGALSVLIATSGLIGWMLDADTLKNWLPTLSSIKANATLAALAAGLALLLWEPSPAGWWRTWLSRAGASIAALLGLLTLIEYLFGLDLGIDQLFFEEQAGALEPLQPNRMAPNLAFGLLAAGTAILLLGSHRRKLLHLSQALAITTALIGILALVGYAYGVQAFIGIGPYTSIALPAAVSLLLLAAGALLAQPDQGLMAVVTSPGFGGMLARRLLPVMLLAPLVLGSLILQGARGGLYGQGFAMSLLAVFSILLFGALAWATAVHLDRIDRERRMAREELWESESRFRAAIEGAFDAFFILKSVREETGRIVDFEFTDANARAGEMVGISRDKLIGGRLCELLPHNRTEGFFDRYVRMVEDRKPIVEEFEVSTPQISAGWLYHQVIPLGDGIAITSRDITRRKLAEQDRDRLTRHLQLLLQSTDEGLYGIDIEGRCTFINESAARMIGYDPDEVMGKNMHDLIHYRHDDGTPYPTSECPIFVASRGGSGTRLDSEVFWRSDGSSFPVEYSSYPILENGTVQGAVVTFTDITERKQTEESIRNLNQTLVERAAELTSINRELEAFSYSVSHDLRAPLRSIDGFSLALLEDYEDRLDEEGRDYLHRVRAASQKMGQLIDDILNLSRVTRSEIRQESVDLSAMAQSIAADLRARNPDRQAAVRIEPDLRASGDPRLLRIALQNLVENAWKFTSRRPLAQIEIGAVEKDGKTVYYVRDNGAGFDMAYVGKLFGAFQRLHGHGEYSGTGIGLATVQRIIHRHGGRIWAEGEQDRGATFYFTL